MKQLKRPRNQEFVNGGEMLELKTKVCPYKRRSGVGSNGNWGQSLHLQRDLVIILTPFGCHKNC